MVHNRGEGMYRVLAVVLLASLVLPAGSARGVSAHSRLPAESPSTNAVASCSLGVRLVGQPKFWVVPNAPGYGSTSSGHLWFGVFVANCSPKDAFAADLVFRSYTSDGTPYTDCSRLSPLDLGGGAAADIAPGETAWVTCEAGIASRTLQDLQISARIWDAWPVQHAANVDYKVVQTKFGRDAEFTDPMGTGYMPSALVRSTLSEDDTLALLLFRFYDSQGVQVGTCESNIVVLEPGISRQVPCQLPITIDVQSPQPQRVVAVPLPCRVPAGFGPVLIENATPCA